MRSVSVVGGAALLALSGILVATGLGDSPSADEAGILKVMGSARAALLKEDGQRACGLLTSKGRKRTLAFNVDYDEDGAIPPEDPRLPQTCEQLVRRQWRGVHACDADPRCRGNYSWPRALRQGRFTVAWVRDGRAKVRLRVDADPPVVRFWLVKTPNGWRIDNADILPTGH